MGSAAIVTILVQNVLIALAVAAVAYVWYTGKQRYDAAEKALQSADYARVQAELALKNAQETAAKMPRVINSAPKKQDGPIMAASAADVRRLTEKAWGLRPEIGETNGPV